MDEKWKSERRKGIGGSDAAAILGLSPWKNAMDVWLEKTGLAEERVDPAREFLLDLGTELEPVIAKLYSRETKRSLRPGITVVHKDHPVLRGNPDRIVVGEPRGIELKSENQFMDKFGEPGTDEVPFHYLVQCAHYMAIMDFPVWDIALLHGGTSFSIYTVKRDLELECDMEGQLLGWWEKHVVNKVPPDVDGSGAWKAYLRRKFPTDLLPVMDADTDTLKLVNSLRTVREIVDRYTGLEYELQNRIKLIIGEHQGIQGDFGKITWKKTKDAQIIDWPTAFKIACAERSSEQIEGILKSCTTPKAGSRRFLFKENKEWVYGERDAISEGNLPDDAHALQAGDRAGAAEAPERRPDGTDRAHELPAKS